ncbi:glycosyltransferase, partial [uncultured Muribaculum sp.]
EATHKNLYHTFTPHDTRNVSRKKLAITLGIKAARYESIVLVTADSRITSQRWLEKMARHFNDPEKDIVIGYAFPDLDNVANTPSRSEVHDWLIDIVHYLAAALDGHTYRGDGDNLAYRRSLFFKNKGFSQSLNLSYGDDDVFIHQCSTPRNVAVELSRESHVSTSFANPREAMKRKKLQYTFTSSHAGKWQHRLYGFCLALLWVWLLLTAASIAIAPRNIIVIGSNIVVALLLWVPLIASWNSASRALGGHRFFFSVPLALLWRPIRNIIYYIKSHRAHSGQYAWQTLGPSNWSKLTDDIAK